jgi:hypothetical protein
MKRNFAKDESGHMLLITAFALVSMLGMAALSIDVGFVGTARTQLQGTVDAAALAGASGLLYDQSTATSRAIQFAARNRCITTNVSLSSGDISFPTGSSVRVEKSMSFSPFFSRIVGLGSLPIKASATAEIIKVIGTTGMAPLAVPDYQYHYGDPVTLKAGKIINDNDDPPHGDLNNSWHYPVCFPPINRGDPETGAAVYEDNLTNGTDHYAKKGDVLLVEPGEMTGPTKKGVDAILNRDPAAQWNGSQIIGSAFPDGASPRIVIIPLFDSNNWPSSGRNSITITGLGVFFVERMNGQDVIGRFVKKIKSGTSGSGSTMVYGVKLIE